MEVLVCALYHLHCLQILKAAIDCLTERCGMCTAAHAVACLGDFCIRAYLSWILVVVVPATSTDYRAVGMWLQSLERALR